MEEQLTIKDVLIITRDLLRGIGMIPIEEAEQIGVPVGNAIRNLDVCIRAIEEDEARKQEVKDGNSDSE